ncbi:MAG: galactosyldiacylglycerol synthase [Romboutsia sp.]|nr:galactosyldiacylglycerol synthase [Romboutsia sp.]
MSINSKTILILTAQFGAGHISAAKAIKDYIIEEYSDSNILIENFIDASLPIMNKPMVKLYEKNTKYTPGLYNYYYYLKKSFDPRHDISHKLYTPKLIEYILKVNPDLIISTFPLAAACVYNFIEKYPNIKIPTLTVITDVVDSLEWVYPNTIKVTGVPISKNFNVENKDTISRKYKILLLGGGRGLFDVNEEFMYWIDNFIENYKDNIEITIVTGSNLKLYNNLTYKNPLNNIKVLGFINNMHELLEKSDFIITKPGGATLFEAIYANTPVIVKAPKVGQEIENAKFIIDKGIGLIYNDEKDLKDIFIKMANEEFRLLINFMKDNMIEFKKTIHPNKICEYISELINNKS